MISFKTYIEEARKNPELNPKQSINDIIAEYLKSANYIGDGIKNAYVSFTSIEKLGINPKSSYNTPLGIYSYPLTFVEDEIGSRGSTTTLPFAGDQPYANLFQLKGHNVIIFDDLFIEDEEQYLYKKIYKKYQSSKGNEHITKVIADANFLAKYKTPAGRFWYVTKELSNNNPIKWNKLLREIDIDAIYDHNNGIIHSNEPHQCVVLNTKSITNVKRVFNKYSPNDVLPAKAFGHLLNKFLKKNEMVNFYEAFNKLTSKINLINGHKTLFKVLDKRAFQILLKDIKTNPLDDSFNTTFLQMFVYDESVRSVLNTDHFIQMIKLLRNHSDEKTAYMYLNQFYIGDILKNEKIFNEYINSVKDHTKIRRKFIKQFLQQEPAIQDDHLLEMFLLYIFETPLDYISGVSKSAKILLQTHRVKQIYKKINKNEKLLSLIRNFFSIKHNSSSSTIEKILENIK